MITTDHIKELKHITYDRHALEDFYNSIKHKAKPYIEKHTEYLDVDADKSPYFRCICPKCLPLGKHNHSGDDHKFIRRLDRFNNPEVERLTKLLEPITKTSVPNFPVLWIYEPGFTLPPHKDFARKCSIMVPILPAEGGATVNIYNDDLPVIKKENYQTVEHNDEYLIGSHVYNTNYPTALNAHRVIHGVQNQDTVRVFINFSGYLDWNLVD
jgi:hypothetical protein